jgi:hypothetical protein
MATSQELIEQEGKKTGAPANIALAKYKFKIAEQKARSQEAVTARVFEKKAEAVLKAKRKLPAYLRGGKKGFGREAVKGIERLGRAFLNPSMMSEAQFLGTQAAPGQSQPGRGRGRPMQSFTPKMLPDGTIVTMPVQAFKRAVSMQKAQMRLQAELQKTARLEAYPSPDQVPMRAYDEEDKFLDTEDQSAMAAFQQRQQMAQMQAQGQPGMPQQRSRWDIRNMFGRQQPQYPQQMGPGGSQFVQAPPMSPASGQVQRLSFWNGGMNTVDKSRNIMNAPNVFNKPGEASIGVARRQQMQQQQFYQ